MEPTQEQIKYKADILKMTADRIENGSAYYNWYDLDTCNVGILCQTVLGTYDMEFGDELFDETLCTIDYSLLGWSGFKPICDQTGIPLSKIYRELFRAGFTMDDLREIEFCHEGLTEELLLQKTNYGSIDFSKSSIYKQDYADPQVVVKFMRDKADKLMAAIAS